MLTWKANGMGTMPGHFATTLQNVHARLTTHSWWHLAEHDTMQWCSPIIEGWNTVGDFSLKPYLGNHLQVSLCHWPMKMLCPLNYFEMLDLGSEPLPHQIWQFFFKSSSQPPQKRNPSKSLTFYFTCLRRRKLFKNVWPLWSPFGALFEVSSGEKKHSQREDNWPRDSILL